jgi:hypothetical protein
MAMKGKVYRNEEVRALLRLSWYGLVDDAIAHLRSINPDEIKAPEQIEEPIVDTELRDASSAEARQF